MQSSTAYVSDTNLRYYGKGTGDLYIQANIGSVASGTYSIEDCIRYDPTDYVNAEPTKDWSLPSQFKLSFIINSDSWSGSSGSSNVALIRFNNSGGVWCGKGSSTSRNIYFNGSVLNQISANVDTEYTLTYNNGSCTFSSGTDTLTATVSLTKLYSISAQANSHAHLKNIKIKPL